MKIFITSFINMFSCMCHQANNYVLSVHEQVTGTFLKNRVFRMTIITSSFCIISRKTRYLETVRRDKWATLSMKYYAYWDI